MGRLKTSRKSSGQARKIFFLSMSPPPPLSRRSKMEVPPFSGGRAKKKFAFKKVRENATSLLKYKRRKIPPFTFRNRKEISFGKYTRGAAEEKGRKS